MSTAAAPPPRLRSALFVPGDRADFLAKLAHSPADAVILDLEDAVSAGRKARAREEVARWLATRPAAPVVCARLNPLALDCLAADLEAVVSPALRCVLLPKVEAPEEVAVLERALAERERAAGLAEGAVRIWPLVETARAVRSAYEIASATPLIAYMGGSAGDQGDLALELGFRWSADFVETLYVRSKVLVDVRAAGVPNPMTGVVTSLGDTGEVEAFARQSRGLGYRGMMVIHPSHVEVVNAVFSPTDEELAAARRLLAAMERAERDGEGAIAHEGGMIDAAMVRVARELLSEAEQLGGPRRGRPPQ